VCIGGKREGERGTNMERDGGGEELETEMVKKEDDY
jgi:hypothetical protein